MSTDDWVAWALRRLYYRQQAHRRATGHYASTLDDLAAHEITVPGHRFEPHLERTATTYEISAPGAAGTRVRLRHDGKVTKD